MKEIMRNHEMKVSTIAAVLGIVDLIVLAVLSKDGENSSQGIFCYVLLAAAIVIQLVTVAMYAVIKEHAVIHSILRFLQTGCYVAALAVFIMARMNWLFRIMSKMSAAPLTALFPITIALIVITVIIQVVCTYLPYED